jgi:hypothetical protein
MGPISLALIAVGLVLVIYGTMRARDPYRRYTALKEQDANIARYEAWRGGVRSNDKTGASVAMEILRRQTQVWAAVAVAGIVAVVIGLLVR